LAIALVFTNVALPVILILKTDAPGAFTFTILYMFVVAVPAIVAGPLFTEEPV
jgi:hypothetical protein